MPAGSAKLDPVASLLGRIVRSEGVRGAGVAIVHRGGLVLEHYEGVAAPGHTAGPDTLWPLASISKLYTAAVVMRMLELGEISLSTRIETILPRMTADGRDKVTLRQLMTHTSGLIYESPEMPELLKAQAPLHDIVDEAYTRPLSHEPGSDQVYSDLGYALAGRAVSVKRRAEFHDLMRELVLAPAGLSDTWQIPPDEVKSRIAYINGGFAEGTPGAMYNSDYARGLAHPAFGVIATLRDLLNFALLFTPHTSTRIFSGAAIRTMVSDQTGGDFPGEETFPRTGIIHPWGIGFVLKGNTGSPDLVSPDSFGHLGATGCSLWIDPVLDLVVVYVSNRHYNSDRDGFLSRSDRVINLAAACVTT